MGSVSVIPHPTARWANLKEWHDKEKRHGADDRACWPHIAVEMVRLRQDFKTDQDFGAAIVMHGIEYNKDDRAAFIWMGSLKPQALEDAIARCERDSPKYFRREVESWNNPYYLPVVSPRSETAAEHQDVPDSVETASDSQEMDAEPESEEPKSEQRDRPAAPAIDKRAVLAQFGPNAALLHDRCGVQARRGINALCRKNPKLIRFLIEAIASGRIDPAVPENGSIHAGAFVNGLDRSITKNMRLYDAQAKRADARSAKQFMEHFDLLLAAAKNGWTYDELIGEINGRHVARKGAEPESWTRPARLVEHKGELPAAATLADGTALQPKPIVICGEQVYPFAGRELPYEDAYLWAHICRDLARDHQGGVREVGDQIAHLGKLYERHHQQCGAFICAIGIGIKARGGQIDKAQWFSMETLKQKTAG